jgi:hypothetical protein
VGNALALGRVILQTVISRVVVVPHPPLLVPELVTGAATETEPVRAACVGAARELTEVARDWLAIAADPAGPLLLEPSVTGSFRSYGVDVPVSLSAGVPDAPSGADLPLPALVAGWLRAKAGADTVRVQLLAPDLPTADCLELGARLAADPRPTGLLVLADGSNRRGDKAPTRPDDRAEPFDEALRVALAAPNPTALAELDLELAAELGLSSRAAFQVLAGVALGWSGSWRSRVDYSAAPYGVGYHVAVWDPVR